MEVGKALWMTGRLSVKKDINMTWVNAGNAQPGRAEPNSTEKSNKGCT